MGLETEKDRVRSSLKAERAGMSPSCRKTAEAQILRYLEELCCRKITDEDVLIYYPVGGEVDVTNLKGFPLYLPAIAGDRLEFRSWQPGDALEAGEFGIPVPSQGSTWSEDRRAIVVAPSLGVDHKGTRLGYGGGFYDRFFARNPQVLRVGVQYQALIRSELPKEDFDVALHYLVTECGITSFGGA